jgi:hypothetical protein
MTALPPADRLRAPARRDASDQLQVPSWWAVGIVSILLAHIVYVAAWFRGDPTGRGLIIGPLVVAMLLPFILRLRRTEVRFDLAGIVLTALGLKLCLVYARLFMVDHIYGSVGDSFDYDHHGRAFAPYFRALQFDVDPGRPVPGTGFLRILTGVVYAVFGADRFTGFIVFGVMSFIGIWLFYQAFVMAVPEGDHRRYALLVFFWPSLVFWPAATGKEAWMVFALGLASNGAARVFSQQRSGYTVLTLGIAAAALPRPHIAIVVLAAVAAGLATATLVGAGAGGRSPAPATRIVGVIFIAVASVILAPQVATFLQIDDVGTGGLDAALSSTQERTAGGGSSFEAVAIASPVDYPWGFASVLYRPFPHEVRSAASAISALEGLLLLALTIASLRRMRRLPSRIVRNPYLAYAASFAFMFGYVFSFIANFGILARQRVQLLPFLLVLMSLPAVGRHRSKDGDAASTVPPRAVMSGRGVRLVESQNSSTSPS